MAGIFGGVRVGGFRSSKGFRVLGSVLVFLGVRDFGTGEGWGWGL